MSASGSPASVRRLAGALARRGAAMVPSAWAEALRSHHHKQRGTWWTGLVLSVLRLRPTTSLPEVFAIPDACDRRMVRSDSVVCAVVYWLGQNAYEGPEVALWQAFCATSHHVVEIGANVGLYTLNGGLALAPSATYVALEPHPQSHAALLATLRANRLDNVRVEQAAVVADEGVTQVVLRIPISDRYGAPAGAHVAGANPVYGDQNSARDVSVKALGVRALLTQADLIKIDVEGLEAVLLGAVEDILKARRPTIFLEVLDDNAPLIALVHRWVADGVYRIYRIGSNGLDEVQGPVSVGLGGRLRDVVLSSLPPEAIKAVAAPAFATLRR